MSKKPGGGGGTGGGGGGGKQRPQRPQRPAHHTHHVSKPKKPSKPAHPLHHGIFQRGRKTGQTGGRKRGLSIGACSCAAEALAASLRLAGFEVSEADVLDLYYLTANLPGEGATIESTLAAAAEHGLAGFHVCAANLDIGGPDFTGPRILGINLPGPHTVYAEHGVWWSWGQPYRPFPGAVIEEAWELHWEGLQATM